MIHDLTANNDFLIPRTKMLGRWDSIIGLLTEEKDTLSSPYDEVVLTGSGTDRDHKRYIVDYESDERNMCDCCGDPIRLKPWDFDENRTLCPACMEALDERFERPENEPVREITDDNFRVKIRKPWDMQPEAEHPIDNVLLWD